MTTQRSAFMPRLLTLALSIVAPLTGAAEADLATLTLATERVAVERVLDGTIEAVNQGTVSAQTAGRVAELMYDVNDFVPAGAVIVRLRSAEQRASLTQAQANVKEAQSHELEQRRAGCEPCDVCPRPHCLRAVITGSVRTERSRIRLVGSAGQCWCAG